MTERKQTNAEFIAAVKPVCEAATEGPWHEYWWLSLFRDLHNFAPGFLTDMMDLKTFKYPGWSADHEAADATFVKTARLVLPEALDRLEEAERVCGVLRHNKLAADQIMDDAVRALEQARAERDRQMMNALNDQERANDMERERDEMQRVHDAGLKILKGSTEALTEVAQERDELREQLRPGSPTERAPTQWAYDRACEARENWRVQALAAERERDELAVIRAYLDAPPGHQLVPRALTDDMRERADITDAEWRCALQAAPPAPGLEKEPEHV